MPEPTINLALRFHGNFYHSYRGDTPDELGFGKDIRIIRHIIRTLDAFNERGIPVRGTWDFENYFSLETLMPQFCPDIIADMQRRIHLGQDEANLMSYNNGLVSAMTASEFEATIRQGISNSQGSGLKDLFGEGFYPLVRPQEMMFTPIHLKLYKTCGIHVISLFYSAIPFNGFSNFIPRLSLLHRHNPITLTHPDVDETMILLPCYNTGDLLDHLSLRRWIKQLRRYQVALKDPHDLLLLIDMDADDSFWVGFDVPLLKKIYSTINGLQGLVDSILDLDYVRFTTPGNYIESHPALTKVTIHQDTADGSFDGMASWAEKWSNQRLWTGLDRGRLLELQSRHLIGEKLPQEDAKLFEDLQNLRLKITSTTHFGMSAPIMNLTRETTARDHIQKLVTDASQQFEKHAFVQTACQFSLLDYRRGIPTPEVDYQPKLSRSLIRLLLRKIPNQPMILTRDSGEVLPSAILAHQNSRELLFMDAFAPFEQHNYQIKPGTNVVIPVETVHVDENSMDNGILQLKFDQNQVINSLKMNGIELSIDHFLTSAMRYAGHDIRIDAWQQQEAASLGLVGMKRIAGITKLKDQSQFKVEYEIVLALGLPYIYLTMCVAYPETQSHCDPDKAERLQRTWDDRWQEVSPCELHPNLVGRPGNPLRIWKHNYCDHVTSYALDYEQYSKNIDLDSVNNHVTDAWVAVSDGQKGLLLAQTADVNTSMAFCPMRLHRQGQKKHIYMNPFGSYSGRQYHYATRDTGLGKFLAVNMSASDHIKPYAPSYNGQEQVFRLMIAPYTGDRPPETIQQAAEAFAYPYILLNDADFIADPPHRQWDGAGLG
jgi:hypothetical protein